MVLSQHYAVTVGMPYHLIDYVQRKYHVNYILSSN